MDRRTLHRPAFDKVFSISAAVVEKLVSRWREAQVTMTPLLQCVTGKVLLEMIAGAEVLRCATAISMRQSFPDAARIDDNLVSFVGEWIRH